ncbi:MAG: hypothetical protein WKF75_04350 [Singulisphaera sp.]
MSRPIRLRPVLAAALAGLLATPPADADAPGPMAAIIEDVRANEDLYRNIEFVVRKTYRVGTPMVSHGEQIASEDQSARVVLQDGLIYLNIVNPTKRLDGATLSVDTLQGFDGETTRILEQNAFANIHDGRREDARIASLRPYTLMMNRAFVKFPFSVYLAGGKEVERRPEFSGWSLVVSYECEEELDGLACSVVRARRGRGKSRADPKNRPLNVRHLWLAHDRNSCRSRPRSATRSTRPTCRWRRAGWRTCARRRGSGIRSKCR